MNKFKRTSAIIGIILVLSLPIISLIIALTSNNLSLLMASMFCTVIIPIMIYILVAVYKYVHRNEKKDDEHSLDKED